MSFWLKIVLSDEFSYIKAMNWAASLIGLAKSILTLYYTVVFKANSGVNEN